MTTDYDIEAELKKLNFLGDFNLTQQQRDAMEEVFFNFQKNAMLEGIMLASIVMNNGIDGMVETLEKRNDFNGWPDIMECATGAIKLSQSAGVNKITELTSRISSARFLDLCRAKD